LIDAERNMHACEKKLYLRRRLRRTNENEFGHMKREKLGGQSTNTM
jgi:hypothetical protein